MCLETRFVRVLNNFQKSACLLTFIRGNFLPVVNEHMFYVFVSKVQNEQEILLFLHWR